MEVNYQIFAVKYNTHNLIILLLSAHLSISLPKTVCSAKFAAIMKTYTNDIISFTSAP